MSNHNSGTPKAIKKLLEDAERAGIIVTRGRGGHYKMTGAGWVITVSVSPKNPDNCVKAIKRDLKRNGVVL